MTSPDPMSREELLELAPLDAFGLLDDYEAALFNRSFHHAPATVQAEIRAMQAELAEDPSFLATEDPRPLLRQKVLLSISEEIEEAAEELKPLATIGGAIQVNPTYSHPAALRTVAASVTAEVPPSQDETMRELVAEIRARSAASVRDRATPYWRAAAFFLAAGLVVALFGLASTMRTAERIAQLAQQDLMSRQLQELVPDLNDFAYRSSHIRSLTSSDSSVNAAATLYVDRANRRALLFALGLSASEGPFTLRVVDDRGNATVIATFETDKPVFGMVAQNISDDILSRKLELLDSKGKVILQTA